MFSALNVLWIVHSMPESEPKQGWTFWYYKSCFRSVKLHMGLQILIKQFAITAISFTQIIDISYLIA